MASLLMYSGYVGSAEISDEDDVFHGKLLGIRALVTYEAETVKGLREAFTEAVDDYVETMKAQGKQPEVPFKGVFNVRTSSELHRRVAIYAEMNNKKLNTVVNEALHSFLAPHADDTAIEDISVTSEEVRRSAAPHI